MLYPVIVSDRIAVAQVMDSIQYAQRVIDLPIPKPSRYPRA